ncbi:MAG TPA: hypothetical protein VF857_06445 [Spirochaetota bacterium]
MKDDVEALRQLMCAKDDSHGVGVIVASHSAQISHNQTFIIISGNVKNG